MTKVRKSYLSQLTECIKQTTVFQRPRCQLFQYIFFFSPNVLQATAFLHENGVMLHYEDATLKDLYFLDPQWLCDMLAHVVTIREINPFAPNGKPAVYSTPTYLLVYSLFHY